MSSGAYVSANASFRAGSTVGTVVPTYGTAPDTVTPPHTSSAFRIGSTVGPVVPTYRQALNTAPSPHTPNIFRAFGRTVGLVLPTYWQAPDAAPSPHTPNTSRALGPRSARQMCNESLDDSDCANNWESARQGLTGRCCTQSVQATRLAPILRKDRIDN